MSATSFNGNTLLKGINVPVEWTVEQVQEWVKCKDDPLYFIEKYVKIVTLDHGLQPMKMYDFQKEIVTKSLNHRKIIVKCARQNGKSTTIAALLCHFVIFNELKTCAILANKASTAREILSRVQGTYEHLPKWLQHGVKEWNKGSFVLENGSRILAAATTSDGIRGFSVDLLCLDEFSFVPSGKADEFFTSVYPTISSSQTSKLLIVSTPKGMNHFYKLWEEAVSGVNGFEHVEATWRAVPWRDEKWADEQRRVLGDERFSQEMETVFLGSTSTLITPTALRSLVMKRPIVSSSYSSVYERPIPGHRYCITADTARGGGGDYSAFVVFDVTALPYKVVFKYRNNTISSMVYPSILFKAAREYNNCSVLIETNDVGESVANSLYHDYEYEETIFCKDNVIVAWGGAGSKPGLRTTTKTKRVGCDTLKQLIENNKLEVCDSEIIMELSNFAVKGKSFEAENGNDDLAMCLVLFAYLVTSAKFQEISDASVRERILQERKDEEEQNMLPAGFYSNGVDDPENDGWTDYKR